MDSRHGKKRMNVEADDDRLSNLPDDLIHLILSFIDITQAIETSELSSRWRYIWTLMPSLSFSCEKFRTMPEFSKFVTDVLFHRNNQIDVFSVKLSYRASFGEEIVERILNYALSHNVQQLNATCLYGRMDFPLSVFTSRSLKHLTLDGYFPPTWDLPALETLNVYNIPLFDDSSDKSEGLFSNCANLKNLTFKECILGDSNGFSIHHSKLSNLTLDDGCGFVNVVTPQLKNLTIIKWGKIHLISAPNLSSLIYKDCGYDYDEYNDYKNRRDMADDPCDCGVYNCDCNYKDNYGVVDLLQLSTQLYHLEKVDICIDHPYHEGKEYMQNLFKLLQQLQSVKFLTLNWEVVELLSSWLKLVSDQPSPFVSLEALKIYPFNVDMEEDSEQQKVTFSDEVRNYLLDSSPGATLTTVSYEEVIAMNNATLASNLIGELQVLLEECKENSKTNAATMHEQVEAGNHVDTKMEWRCGARVKRIKSYWADMNTQLEEGRLFTDNAISLLQGIETVLEKMPESYKVNLEATYSSLSAEANTMMDNMMDRMKMQGDTKPNRSDVYFHESSASSHPLS